jgi:hypothetical protein
MTLRGKKNIDQLRFIQNAGGGSVFVTHYIYRPGPGGLI